MPLPTSIRLQLQKLQKTPVLFHGTGHYDYVNHSDEIPLVLRERAVTLTTCPDAAFDDAIKAANGVPAQGAILLLDATRLRARYYVLETFERGSRRVYIEEPIVDVSQHLLGVLMTDDVTGAPPSPTRPPADPRCELNTSVRERLHLGLLKIRAKAMDCLNTEDQADARWLASLDSLMADVAFGPNDWPLVTVANPRTVSA